MAGRNAIPGDHNKPPVLESSAAGRTWLARIHSVDTKNGIAHLHVPALGKPVSAVIDLGALSGHGFSWSCRLAVPQRGSWVRIGFDGDDNTPYIVAPAVFEHTTGFDPAKGNRFKLTGYAAYRDKSLRGVKGYREWLDLKEGEWFDRSSGGASVHGSSTGVLALAAGPSSLTLDKERYEIVTESGLIALASDATFVRVGDVKTLLLPTDFLETKIPGTTKYFHVHVADQAVPGGPELTTLDWRAGDVRDGVVPRIGPVGLTKSDFHLTEAVTGATVFREQLDLFGNVTRFHPPLAVVDESGSGALKTSTFLSQILGAELPARGVLLGSEAAPFSVPLGEPVVAQLQAIVVQLQALVVALTALGGGLVLPGPTIAGPALATAMTPIATALVAIQVALGLAPGTLISNKVKTDP